MNFLILRKTGPNPTDLQVVDIVEEKKATEGEQALQEATLPEEGKYLAVPFDKSKIVRRKAERSFSLVEEDIEAEAAPPAETKAAVEEALANEASA